MYKFSSKLSRKVRSSHRLLAEIETLESRAMLAGPDGTGFSTELVISGLNQPTSFDFAPDGRMFVAEKDGRVQIVENGAVVSTFLDINEEVHSGGAKGLLGLKLDPDFANNNKVYLNYTVEQVPESPDDPAYEWPAGGQLISIEASAANANLADESTRVVILDGHVMTHITHSVGEIDFDNDGNIIFLWGDGGFDNSLRLETQNPDSKQGKLFRIDPDTLEGVPENPFYDPLNPDSVRSKVWAVGFRNPWRMSVDSLTGDVFVTDVKDGGPEEINVVRGDGSTVPLNYGWPYFEDVNPTAHAAPPAGFAQTSAWVAYPHTGLPGGDNLTGGVVFRGPAYPAEYNGRFFFANFRQNTLYTADAQGDFQQFGSFGGYDTPVKIAQAPDGTIYFASLFTGEINRLVHSGGVTNIPPDAISTASVSAGATPLTVTFDGSSSSDANGDTLSYSWDFDTNGTVDSTEVAPTFTFSTVGRTTTTLTVDDGRGGQDTSIIEIDTLLDHPRDGNVALGRPVTQSTIDAGGLAARAVDGNTDGDFANESASQTTAELTPFLEVDLESVHDITDVVLHSRTDGQHALEDYWLLIRDVPFGSANLGAAASEPGVTAIEITGTTVVSETIPVNRTGRYVRVQMSNVDVLSLAEFQIFSLNAADLARVVVDEGQTATMSGTFSIPGATLSASVGSVIDNGDGSWTWTAPTTDGPDDSQTVTITADDGAGTSSDALFDLVVNNVAPSVAPDQATVSVDSGEVATMTGTYGDPGNDTVTLTTSLGTVTDLGSGNWSWSYPATGSADSQTVTVTATDSDGSVSTTTFDLAVFDTLLTLTLSKTSIIEAGETAVATVTRQTANLGSDLEVTISLDDTSEVTVPTSVTIPSGQPSATFDITGIDDLDVDGTQSVLISVSAPGFEATPLAGEASGIALYPFDDGTGNDAIGTFDGTLVGGASIVVDDAEFGQVLNISGTPGDYLEIANQPALEVGASNADFSLGFWVKLETDSTGTYRRLIQKGNSWNERTFALFLQPDSNRIHYRISTNGTFSDGGNSLSELPLNTWTHVTYVKAGNELQLYMDGTLDSVDVLLTDTISNDGSIFVGHSSFGGSAAGARYDDVYLVSRALSATEVQLLSTQHSVLQQASASASLQVTDFEGESLTLQIADSEISEIEMTTGTITRDPLDIHRSLDVNITINDTTEATAPAIVTIPAGATSATFDIDGVDDLITDGTQTVAIQATNQYYVTAGSATLAAQDAAVALYSFDDGTGNDSIGGFDGNLVGSAAIVADDPDYGQVLDISGDPGDYFEVPNQSALEFGDANADFSLGFWVKLETDATGTYRRLIQKGNSWNDRTFALLLRPDSNRIHYRISTTGTFNEGGDSVAELPLNTWTHVAYVKAGNRLELYLDGALDSFDTLVTDTISNDGSIFIGHSTFGGRSAPARYDDVYLVDRAMTPTEVQLLATQHASTLGSGTSPTLDVTDVGGVPVPTTLTLEFASPEISEAGETTIATVTRDATDLSQSLDVLVSVDDASEVTVPTMVTIPVGSQTATFPVTGIDDLEIDGTQTVSISVASNELLPGNVDALGHYPFDDGTPDDAFGTHDGLLNADASIVSEPGRGQVLNITGSLEGYFAVPNAPELEVGAANGDFSVALWVKLEEGPSGSYYRRLIQKANEWEERTFAMMVRPESNRIHYRISSQGTFNEGGDSVAELQLNTWTHIAYVKTGNELQLYLDGVLDSSDTLMTDTISNDGDIFIGASDFDTKAAAGKYDDVYLVSRALSAGEVQELATLPHVSEELNVTDFEGKSLTLTLADAEISETEMTTGTVTRDPLDIHRSLDVTITIDDTTEATAPAIVTIPAGATSATFDINGVEDSVADGTRTVSIQATNQYYVAGGSVTLAAQDAAIAFYSFDDGTGNDSIGSFDGSLVGNTAIVADDPAFGQVLDISGDPGDYFEVPNQSALEVGDANADFSLGFWVKLETDATGTYRRLIQKGNSWTDRTFALLLRPDSNRIHYRISTTGTFNEGGDSVAELQLNTWTHIAYVKSGNRLELYLDGVLDSFDTLVTDTISNDGSIFIGHSTFGGRSTAARYDDVYLVDRAMTPTEVQLLATQHATAGDTATLDVTSDDVALAAAVVDNLFSVSSVEEETRTSRRRRLSSLQDWLAIPEFDRFA